MKDQEIERLQARLEKAEASEASLREKYEVKKETKREVKKEAKPKAAAKGKTTAKE